LDKSVENKHIIKAADGRAGSVKYLLILIDKDKVFVTNSQSSAHALSCIL